MNALECENCERCVWDDPDVDCGIAAHPHCEKCGHCIGRHTTNPEELALMAASLLEKDGAQ